LLTKTLRLKHIIFLLLYEALLFLFIVFFLYLEIINQVSVSLQTCNKKTVKPAKKKRKKKKAVKSAKKKNDAEMLQLMRLKDLE